MFSKPQKIHGVDPVCTLCNTTVAAGAQKENIEGHILHDHCAAEYRLLAEAKETLEMAMQPLPGRFFDGNRIRENIASTCRIDRLKEAVTALCEHLMESREWMKKSCGKMVDETVAILYDVCRKIRAFKALELLQA